MGKKERKAALEAQKRQEIVRSEGILKIIGRAFDGVDPPDEVHRTLYQAEAWDDYRTVDQRRDHKGLWQDLPEQHIHECQNALPHLDEQGIQYYLPALMSHFVSTSQKKLHGWIYDSLLYTLQPSTGDLKKYQRQRFSLLTPPQRAAILAFLEYIEAPEEDLNPWRKVVGAGDAPDWFRKFY